MERTMSEDIEVPRRGYDTKDVEAMSRALDTTESGGARKVLVGVVLVLAVVAAVWLIAMR
jgi:hypothetical protein